jgi:hypothetical protein
MVSDNNKGKWKKVAKQGRFFFLLLLLAEVAAQFS